MATTSAAIKDLSDQNSQGTRLGTTSTDKICFYGITTAIAQVSVIGSSIGSASTATVSTAGIFGFTTSTQANQIVTTMLQLRLLGIIA